MDLAREFADICDALLKRQSANDVDTFETSCAMGAVKILELKEAHFGMCQATEELRESTTDAMNRLDESSLQLENLLYEKGHYEREIQACKSYKSAYTDEELELLSSEEYAERTTDTEVKSRILSEDPHTAMLARLEEELKYREEVLKDLETLKIKRDALAAQVAQRRDTIAGLQGDISSLRSSAHRIQQQYEPDDKNISQELPGPLYMLYSNAVAIAALLNLPVTVSIVDCRSDLGSESPEIPKGRSHPCSVNVSISSVDTADQNQDGNGMAEDGSYREPLVISFRYFPHAHMLTMNAKDERQVQVLEQLFSGKDAFLAEKDESMNAWVVKDMLSLDLYTQPDPSIDPMPLSSIPCGPGASLGTEKSLQTFSNVLSLFQKLINA